MVDASGCAPRLLLSPPSKRQGEGMSLTDQQHNTIRGLLVTAQGALEDAARAAPPSGEEALLALAEEAAELRNVDLGNASDRDVLKWIRELANDVRKHQGPTDKTEWGRARNAVRELEDGIKPMQG